MTRVPVDWRSAYSPNQIKALATVDRTQAMDVLYSSLHMPMTLHLFKMLRDYPLAEDIVQETFIRAMDEDRFFLPEFGMKPWLYRVAQNLALNTIRDKTRRIELLNRWVLHDLVGVQRTRYDGLLDRHAAKILLSRYISLLSADHQAVIRLRHIEGLPVKDIQEQLGIPKEGTVLSRLARAKRHLVELLERNGLRAEHFAL